MRQSTKLLNLRPSVRSSTTTTSSRPRALSSRTRLLPMKPAPPVTTIMAAGGRLARVVLDQAIRRAAVRAFRLAGSLDRQINLRMGVPQIHARQGAMQRQVGPRDFVDTLGVRRAQVLLRTAVTWSHRSLSYPTRPRLYPRHRPIRPRRRRTRRAKRRGRSRARPQARAPARRARPRRAPARARADAARGTPP